MRWNKSATVSDFHNPQPTGQESGLAPQTVWWWRKQKYLFMSGIEQLSTKPKSVILVTTGLFTWYFLQKGKLTHSSLDPFEAEARLLIT
jgi:hypothetical protein